MGNRRHESKKNPIGNREFETKQDQRCRGIDRFPEEEEQRHFHQHLTTIRPETPRALPSAPRPDRTGPDVESCVTPRGPPHSHASGWKLRRTSVSGALLTNPAHHIPGPKRTPLPCEETERGSGLRTNGSQNKRDRDSLRTTDEVGSAARAGSGVFINFPGCCPALLSAVAPVIQVTSAFNG